MKVIELWQFPVKGFGGSKKEFAALTPNGYFPNDRHFAISIGHAKTSNASPGTWFPKAHFLQLMSHANLAEYTCSYQVDNSKQKLRLLQREKSCLCINPSIASERKEFEDFIETRFTDQLRGKPHLMNSENQAYTDQSTALISIASKASLKAFANATNTSPDNRRFRINIITDSENVFSEAEMIGKTIKCGETLLLVEKPVGRCAAINVDPETACRNKQDYVSFMREYFGHSNLGVFAKVLNGGTISVGDTFRQE
ncbi:MOSC domain-containing protein [Candidatus Puniceispirillum sp.]|nr:MOSC domain-containing protein [Candidatus Puniceispirillum sp.]